MRTPFRQHLRAMEKKRTIKLLNTAGALAVLGACALSVSLAPPFRIPWKDYQLLDPEWLGGGGLLTLLCLPSQPPLLNAAAYLSVEGGIELWALYHSLLGLLALGSLLWLLHSLKIPFLAVSALAALLVLSPEVQWFWSKGSYTFPTFCLFLLFALCLKRWRETAHTGWYLGLGAVIVLISLYRALYHPVFCIFLLLAAGLFIPKTTLRKRLVVFTAFSLLLLMWPLKNSISYGFFGSSSWTGLNLARMAGGKANSNSLTQLRERGTLSRKAKQRLARAAPLCRDQPYLSAPKKPNGAENWHHIAYVVSQAKLKEDGIRWRLEHPMQWGELTLRNLLGAFRASHIHPYEQVPLLGKSDWAEIIDRTYRGILYFDLRPAIESLAGEDLLSSFSIRSKPLPVPFLLLVYLGVSSLASWRVCALLSSPSRAIFPILLLAPIVWNIAVPALTDGVELNRMRFETFGLFLLLTAWVISRSGQGMGGERLHSQKRSSDL